MLVCVIADESVFVNLQHKHNFSMVHFGMMLGMMCRTLEGECRHRIAILLFVLGMQAQPVQVTHHTLMLTLQAERAVGNAHVCSICERVLCHLT